MLPLPDVDTKKLQRRRSITKTKSENACTLRRTLVHSKLEMRRVHLLGIFALEKETNMNPDEKRQ